MSYTNFQVGEKFPLPIKAKGDGGLFQIDSNGCMFILQLSRTDVIAVEAFRTGAWSWPYMKRMDCCFFCIKLTEYSRRAGEIVHWGSICCLLV